MVILRDALTRIANEEIQLAVTDLPGVQSADASRVLLKAAARSIGLQRTSSGGLFFDWALDQETALDFADKVDVLSRSSHPGHQYLEIIGTEAAMIMVSIDEYPDDLVP